jgi:hypothetical protein
MKKLLYVVLSIFLLSCSTSENIQLDSTKTITEYFNKYEIKDLQLLLDFFNQEICTSKESDSDYLNQCYEKYCTEIKSEMSLRTSLNPKIDYNKQLNMYEKINKTTFNKIWKIEKSLDLRTNENVKDLGLNYNGKYLDFLKKYGEDNKAVQSYFESIKTSGDISPSTNAIIIKEYKLLDISDIRTKLIIAIHYLTLNDKLNRKEKY